MPFIGEKEIKNTTETGEMTLGGTRIIDVEYHDGLKEKFSQMMYEKVVSDEKCSLEALREKRCQPVVAMLMGAMREWGVKIGELGYISALLNRSLDFNREAAICTLWSTWMPRPIHPDEVDLVTIDRVLKLNGGSGGG